MDLKQAQWRLRRTSWHVLALILTVLASAWRCESEAASTGDDGWRECTISEQDGWVPASDDSLPARMQRDYARRFSCTEREGARTAAMFSFSSECMKKPFDDSMEIRECLRDRRVILFGDSLAAQQADSLVGMLGWDPRFLRRNDPMSQKRTGEDGEILWAFDDCYRTRNRPAPGIRRCYDLFSTEFPDPRTGGTRGLEETPAEEGRGGSRRGLRDLHSSEGGGSSDLGRTSVHLRAWPTPMGDNWLVRALRDFNSTSRSDIVVVNFGPHYLLDQHSELKFREDVAEVLLAMGSLSERATMVWREIAPTHFPSPGATFDNFSKIPRDKTRGLCCTGTPPEIYPRNQWVDDFIEENGLREKVKVLRIYQMSLSRGAAHRTCHGVPPGQMEATDEAEGTQRLCLRQEVTDCRHWSEPGVVEEWNKLMLNHLCPA